MKSIFLLGIRLLYKEMSYGIYSEKVLKLILKKFVPYQNWRPSFGEKITARSRARAIIRGDDQRVLLVIGPWLI